MTIDHNQLKYMPPAEATTFLVDSYSFGGGSYLELPMQTISLTQSKYAVVDDADYESVSRFRWRVTTKGYAHTCMHIGYIGGKRKGKHKLACVYLHRLIMRPPKGMEIDHINHDPLDCQRSNMRICTRSQNGQNQIKTRGTSKFKGVCWCKRSAKWLSHIVLKGKTIHIGYFDDETEAAHAYDTKARELFGEFAHCNFKAKG